MESANSSKGSSGNRTSANISVMLPGLIELTAVDPDFPWGRIDRLFRETWDNKVAEASGETFQTEATFFFMLLAALKGESLALGYVDYLNRMCRELASQLSTSQKKMLSTPVKNLLRTPNLDFLNFAGELSTLNNLLKSNAYELEKVESPLGNSNSIDFRLKNRSTRIPILVEVVNIQVDDEKVEDDPEKIHTFFAGRLLKKIEKKEKELAGTTDFWLVAVLWASWNSLDIYRRHFLSRSLNIARTIEPLAYLQHSDGRGYYMHQFGRVSTLRIVDGERAGT
jgi:hypothetical protein